MIARRALVALAAAAVVAVAMPLALLLPGRTPPAAPERAAPEPLSQPQQPPLALAFERPLFGGAAEPAEAPQDAPALVGIVGRLDQDAVALVRTADGSTRTLKVGESMDGWTLASLAIDAAYFTRGIDRVRVPLPAAQ